jgi:prolyl-tRNA editing enzyme YbaK/EbsC (Cys-tRNA(Pro) deacylase)
MSYEKTIKLLDDSGVEYTMHEHRPFLTVADMEAYLPFPKEQFLKTLAFKIKNSFWVLAAMKGDARVDYRKIAAAFGISRSHIIRPDPEEMAGVLEMDAGGVCPIPTSGDVRVVVDTAAREDMPHVYCGGVRNDRTLEISMDDLLRVTGAQVAPLVRDADEG